MNFKSDENRAVAECERDGRHHDVDLLHGPASLPQVGEHPPRRAADPTDRSRGGGRGTCLAGSSHTPGLASGPPPSS
jgi:hypothetical protein